MKRKLLLTLSLTAIMAFILATSIFAAHYCDKDGNLVEAGSENIAYEFDVGGDRTIDGNKCFRIGAIYLHDTSLTKIVFPVASAVKSGYDSIAPQSGWNKSLEVYAVNADGTRNTETSYITQIQEVEFLSGADFDGANGLGTFSGFTALTKMVFNGNVSMGNDATNKGGMFKNAPITSIVVKGSGNVNLVIARHISTSNDLTVVFDRDCTSHVYVVRGSKYLLPSASVPNWTFIFNPNLTFGVYSSSLTVTPVCEKGTPTAKFIMAVDDENNAPDSVTSHGLLYSNADQTQIAMEITAWCELGYAEHVNATRFEYANGFASAGVKSVGCYKCNEAETSELSPLFTCLGYSASEYGIGGIAIGYTVNDEAIANYEDATGKTLNYGVFAVTQEKLGDNDIFGSDGTVAKGVITADVSSHGFAAFELKITGFADDQKDLLLAMGAYVIEADDESTEYSYLQDGTPNENEKYCFVSYYDIAGKPSI